MINVLSLFDGMAGGKIALSKAGIKVNNYYASEIDPYSVKVSNLNYPDIINLGDIRNWKNWRIDWASIDLLIGGSPCQGFSFIGKKLNFGDHRSVLFFHYVDILNHIKSVNCKIKFMLENVKMDDSSLKIFNEKLESFPTEINSNLVSAQNRKRNYWASCKLKPPSDKWIFLPSILNLKPNEFKIYQKDKPEKARNSNLKSSCLTGTANAAGNHSQMDVIVMNGAHIPLTSTGRIDIHSNPLVRRYSVAECEMLQTVPVGYCKSVSNSQAYKMLINGWTIDVVANNFKQILGDL